MNYSIKIDWLSFTFKANDEQMLLYNNCFDAFRATFPHIDEILEECVLVLSGRSGRYYDNVLGWNDGILISYDNAVNPLNKKKDCWEHGVNVCLPSHGLGNIYKLLGIENLSSGDDADFFENYKNIYEILKRKNCKISRLDIAFDDFTKTFMPMDFLEYMQNDCLCSPCRSFGFIKNSRGNGQTLYLGCRSSKYLRVYNKSAESNGDIDAVRYEIELHNRYATEVSNMILDDIFDFFQYFEKYFFTVKQQDENKKHIDKRNASRLRNAEEWECFKRSFYEQNTKKIEFPKHTRSVSIEKKAKWIEDIVIPSADATIKAKGIGWFFDALKRNNIDDFTYRLIHDYWRNNNISKFERKCHDIQYENIQNALNM